MPTASITLSGILSLIWGDGPPGLNFALAPVVMLTDASGQGTRLSLTAKQAQAFGGLLALDRQSVTIIGESATSMQTVGPPVLQVQFIQLNSQITAIEPTVSGSHPWVSIGCKFADSATQPQPISYFQNMYSSSFPGLDHYWREQSFNKVNVVGSNAVGWYSLPHPRSYYIYGSPEQTDLSQLANDCTAVADPAVYFPAYDGVNLMFNESLGCCAWGGSYPLTKDGVSRVWSMTWEPPWGYGNQTVMAHEMGHGFGLPHSGGNNREYNNPWDMMGDGWAYCNLSSHAIYGCLGQHTISYHKDRLGWIPAGQKYMATPGGPTTITVERLALPQTGNYLMAQIPIKGSTTHFYTVEVRQQVGYDVKVPGNAVVIHEVDTTHGFPAQVVDADGNDNTGDAGARWTVGETFSDPANGITVAINAATATGFQISITSIPPPNCTDTHEPNNNVAQATSLTYGQTFTGDICPRGDYDYYAFNGLQGDKAVIDINAKSAGSLLDSYISLVDSDGTTVLAENDDEILGQVQDSHLGYQLPHSGRYYILVRAWDHPLVGGETYFYTMRLLNDMTNPAVVQISSPGSDTWLNATSATITVLATDNESGISRVEFLWHSADWQNSDWIWLGADQDPRDGWTWGFNTNSLPEQQGGAFYVWAFDWANNWLGAGAWNLGIDRTPPTVAFNTSPTYGDAPFLDFNTWWSGSDNLSGIAGYDIQYRDGAGGAWTNLLTNTSGTAYHFLGVNGHTYYFRARAHDYAGNQNIYTSGNGDAQYTVQICPVAADTYEADNTYATARLIQTNGSWQTHNIHAQDDRDWVKFSAWPGVTYTLVTANTGGHADTVIDLYSTNGTTVLASNDDDANNWPASRLVWSATTMGTYYLKVTHWDTYAYGCSTVYGVSITPSRIVTVYSVFTPMIVR